MEPTLGIEVGANAFDSIPDELAGVAAAMVAAHAGTEIRSWFPFKTKGRRQWCRFEVTWLPGLILMAVWHEPDAQRHHVHAEPLTR